MFSKTDCSISYTYDNEMVTIETWGKNSLRVRGTKNKEFTEFDWALEDGKLENRADTLIVEKKNNENNQGMVATNDATGDSYAQITVGKLTAVIDSIGVITFRNQNKKMLLKERWARLTDNPLLALNREGREYRSVGGNDFHLAARFESNADEKIFGMGQYQMPFLDMKNCTLELADRNSQATVPFYISNVGYGFLWNNPAIGKVSFSKNETEWVAEATPQLDYLIIAGDTPAEIEQEYMAMTGKAPMMPEYGMGFWQCKLRYRTQDELLGVARKYKELGIQIDVIVADFFHWTQQGEYKFDPECWPDVQSMCKELDEMGIKLMVSVWPTVDYRSENFSEMMEKGLLVRTERGVRVTMQFFGQEVFIDTTNPKTREYVWDKCKQNYWDKGVRLFWLDEAEPEYTVYDYDNYRYYLGTDLEVGNSYPKYYAKGFYEGMKKAGMENPLNLLRCAWAGSAKYGALVWSGDIGSTWESFARQLRAGLSMSIAGIPWWTTDIGGFHGANINDPEFKKILIRWFEWSTFCPVMRLHGFRNPQVGLDVDMISGVGKLGSGAENEIWTYGEEAQSIMTKYIEIREQLRSYIRSTMKETHEVGTPVMRPLFYDFSKDAEAWNVDDEYMFGNELLVAPIYEDKEEREIYLPYGEKWRDVFNNKTYEGGRRITFSAELDQIPVFAKEESTISFSKEKI